MFLNIFERPEVIFRSGTLLKSVTRWTCATNSAVISQAQRCRRCSNISRPNQVPSFFVTTPIFYVNAAPHMGHLYTCVLADAAARYHRLQGNLVLFSTGTDEHGLKIQQAAENHKQQPTNFTANISSKFRGMFDCYNISYTDYIRTTEDRHHTTVQKFWATWGWRNRTCTEDDDVIAIFTWPYPEEVTLKQKKKLETNGCIYKGSYEGWYSISDEAFLRETDVKDSVDKNGQTVKVSVESGHPVTWMEEDNYMFPLSKYKDRLQQWFDTGAIQPSLFEPIARQWLSSLEDLSVSRPYSRLAWGIPVPEDDSQTIYVWLDALVNYLTVCGYPNQGRSWPADVQVIGKDILKFHAIYWPAFLMAAGLDPPKKLFCHSHWLIDSVKMSKSRGNVVDPMVVQDKYSAEVFRYYLLREGVPHADGNYVEEKAMEYVNADLVNTMGNLLSRCTAPSINPDQIYPRKYQDTYMSKITASDRETFENMDLLIDIVEGYYKDMMFYKAIDSIMSYLRWANGVVQQHEIWKLAKSDSETDSIHLKSVMHVALETLRVSGILLQPVIPNLTDRLLNRLGIPKNRRTFECARKPYLNTPEPPLGPNEGVLLKRFKLKT